MNKVSIAVRDKPDALVIAGGGAKAFSALGAVHVLKKAGSLDKLKAVAGTSAGAIVAASVALKRKPMDMCKEFVREVYKPSFDIKNFSKTFGIDSGEHLDKWINIVLDGQHTFESIQKATGIDLIVCTTDLNERKAKYFDPQTTPHADVATVIKMSCTIPLYFNAVMYEDHVFVDGALCDNFPYEYVAAKEGIENPLGLVYLYDTQTGPVENLEQYISAMIHCATEKQYIRDRANVLAIDCGNAKIFDFKQPKVIKRLFKTGVLQTYDWIKKNA